LNGGRILLTLDAEQGSKHIDASLGPAKQIVWKFPIAHDFGEYFLEGHRIHSQSGQVLQTQIHVIVDLSPGEIRLKVGRASRIRRKNFRCGMEADIAY